MELTGTRNALSRLRGCATARLRDQRGSALAAVLVLVVLLTVAGVAMVNSTFTEISVAYNAGDASAAQYAARPAFPAPCMSSARMPAGRVSPPPSAPASTWSPSPPPG